MVSLDMKAMINFHMAEAFWGVLEKRLRCFEKSGGLAKRTDLSAEEVMLLVQEVCLAPYFQCEFGLFKKQEGGVPVEKIFIEDYEGEINYKLSDGTMIGADWLRFCDDTWVIWEHSQKLFDEFLEKLNGIHSKTQWEPVFEDNGQ